MKHQTMTSTAKAEKKTYTAPAMLASEAKSASGNVCGWYTQCGKQVKCRS